MSEASRPQASAPATSQAAFRARRDLGRSTRSQSRSIVALPARTRRACSRKGLRPSSASLRRHHQRTARLRIPSDARSASRSRPPKITQHLDRARCVEPSSNSALSRSTGHHSPRGGMARLIQVPDARFSRLPNALRADRRPSTQDLD